jgi:hypothetical protein
VGDSFPLLGNDGLYRWFFHTVPIRCEWRSDSLVGTNTQPNLKERKKISSRVSTGVRSKSRRTYKGFVRKEQSLETQNQELQNQFELDRFVYNLARLACSKSMLGLIAIVKSPEI